MSEDLASSVPVATTGDSQPTGDPAPPIETVNDFLLGSNGETCGFMFHPVEMDKEKALRTAAWLVALNDPLMRRFPDILKAVCNT